MNNVAYSWIKFVGLYQVHVYTIDFLCVCFGYVTSEANNNNNCIINQAFNTSHKLVHEHDKRITFCHRNGLAYCCFTLTRCPLFPRVVELAASAALQSNKRGWGRSSRSHSFTSALKIIFCPKLFFFVVGRYFFLQQQIAPFRSFTKLSEASFCSFVILAHSENTVYSDRPSIHYPPISDAFVYKEFLICMIQMI